MRKLLGDDLMVDQQVRCAHTCQAEEPTWTSNDENLCFIVAVSAYLVRSKTLPLVQISLILGVYDNLHTLT